MAKKSTRKTAKKQPDAAFMRDYVQMLRDGLEQMRAMQKRIEDLARRLDGPEGKRKKSKR